MQRYLSFGYVITIVAGCALVVADLALVAGWTTPFSAEVATGSFMLAAAMRLLAVTGLVVGLSAIYVRQAERAGVLGLVAYVIAVAALVLQAGTIFTDLFVSGALAQSAPGIVDGAQENARMSTGFLVAWVLNLGTTLLGIATLRSRVFGRVVGWALIVAGVFPLVPLPFDVPVSEIGIGAACIVAGLAARRVPRVSGSSMDDRQVLSNA
jgi:hypothetical protein